MIVIHHNKDLDGFSSGAICKLKYPDAELIGWDYKDPIPDINNFIGKDVILIDISFPMVQMDMLGIAAKSVTWIDHHISARKEYEDLITSDFYEGLRNIKYVYELGVAACEIGWKYLFPDKEVPYAITLLGRYDTWRAKEGDWENETLPFQYSMRNICISAESFPEILLNSGMGTDYLIEKEVKKGKQILLYQEQQDILACQRSSFKKEVYGGLRAVCLNTRAFSTNTMKSVYDPEKHDIMIGFEYTGRGWSVSLRSSKEEVDVSQIAKSRGGGGHKAAAGFETQEFEKIFI